MILLDTDLITTLHGPLSVARDRLVGRLEVAANGGEDVVASVVSFEEQMRGWLSYISRAKDPAGQVPGYVRLHRLLRQYQGLRVLDFDDRAVSQYERLRGIYRRSNTMDLKIAAIALAHDALLLSGNAKDFEVIAGLRFEPFRF